MGKYDCLKKYVNVSNRKADTNSFYLINVDEIEESKKRIEVNFSEELKEFWLEIGYGFFRSTSSEVGITQIDYSNRLLPPDDIVSILTEGADSGIITEQGLKFLKEGEIPIFEIADFTSYLIMKPNSDHPNAVYTTRGQIIEESLEQFIWKLYHVSPTYYLDKY
ncbi:MAG: hypothetical protein Q8R43_03410 [Alphaproteobacteria bacterium]|nr:hypothetical protein [Alphaproteobacteria bacterium]